MRLNERNRRAPHVENQIPLGSRAPITERPPSKAQLARQIGPLVYFARWSDGTIKIGATRNLPHQRSRLGLAWSDILAVQRGSVADAHVFRVLLRAHLAHGRERFAPDPAVLAAINDVRQRQGVEPITSIS